MCRPCNEEMHLLWKRIKHVHMRACTHIAKVRHLTHRRTIHLGEAQQCKLYMHDYFDEGILFLLFQDISLNISESLCVTKYNYLLQIECDIL